MVMMENYRLAQSSFRELWLEIERCHLSYLQMEESPEKMDQRVKLEEYILEFLCIAGNSQKFCFLETEDVLKQSAFFKKDFSGYKAATGFNAIQLYAGNLLSQPWRKEYRQIKTYCGFYKHQIEANLVGAERMFEAMGYQLHGDRLLVLEGPICPDRVKAVSKDCLVAYVECQIWKVIWEELSTAYEASWCEILDFRKNHVCDPEQAVKALKYKQQQRHYQERTPRAFAQGGYDAPQHVDRSFPPPHNHSNVVVPPAAHDCRFAAPGCCSNYSALGPAYGYVSYPDASARPGLTANGFYNGFAAVQPAHPYAVPTANLIEVESQLAVPSYETADRHARKSHHNDQTFRAKNNNVPNNYSTATVEESPDKNGDSQFEDWEYVYRNLKIQGYSKDLGERGDLLSQEATRFPKETKKIKATDLDAALNNLVVTERSKYSEVVKGKTLDKQQTSPGSSYDNLVQPKKPAAVKTKTLPREKTVALADRPSNSRPLDSPKPKDEKSKKKTTTTPVKSGADRWHCKACTFLNETDKDICEMCGKSRSAALDRPIEVGGAECSKCTLVNAKGRTVCEACSASLVGSPTYI